MATQEFITLVDENDQIIGKEEKLTVHKKGLLHRAFSIFVFSPDYSKLLIQQRHPEKYHSGGLWANTTCGHPRYGEDLNAAVHRRLQEEMGFDTELRELFVFHYEVKFDNDLIENEIDHVFIGTYNGPVYPNPTEVINYKWADLKFLDKDLQENPDKYAYWFKIAYPKVRNYMPFS
jgi:isopentenyl-diphosphate delta-isomerase